MLSDCQRKLLLPFLTKLQYFLETTYQNLCFSGIIPFYKFLLLMTFKARTPDTLHFRLVVRHNGLDPSTSPSSVFVL